MILYLHASKNANQYKDVPWVWQFNMFTFPAWPSACGVLWDGGEVGSKWDQSATGWHRDKGLSNILIS